MEENMEFKIKVEGQEWENAIEKAFTRANAKVTLPGFRQGKAPKDVFMKKYGKESLFMDAADIVINEHYIKTLEANKELEIVSEPQIELGNVAEAGIEFTIKLTLKPEVKLGKYKGLKVKKEEPKVTDEEINAEIHMLQHRFEESVIKDGAAEMHDTVVIDFEGFKDGVAFEGGKGENYSLQLGSQTFIPGFEEQLVGLKKDDTKEVKVTFPQDYHSEELKGQEVTFKVLVKEVKENVHRELNKEFFEDLAMEGVNDEKSLKEVLTNNIKVRKEADLENKYIDDLLEAASKNVKVEIPLSMIDSEVHRMLHQYEDNLKMQGLTLEMFYQYTNSNEEALKEQMKEEANKRVLYRLMLEQIAKEENFEISDEEASNEAVNIAKKYNMETEKFLELFGGIEMVKFDLKMRKAIEVLKN
jgi:trigger factor